MNPLRSLPRAATLSLALGLSLVARAPLAAQTSTVTASDAWVREVPAGRAVTGMFLLLKNSGGTERALVRGKADVGDTLELHDIKRENGMMRSSPGRARTFAAGGATRRGPG